MLFATLGTSEHSVTSESRGWPSSSLPDFTKQDLTQESTPVKDTRSPWQTLAMYADPRAASDRAGSAGSDRPFYPVLGQPSNSRHPPPPPRQQPPLPPPPAAGFSPSSGGGSQNPLLRVQIAEPLRTMPPVSAYQGCGCCAGLSSISTCTSIFLLVPHTGRAWGQLY